MESAPLRKIDKPSKKKSLKTGPTHVEFDSDENTEFVVPTYNRSPIPTLSSSGASDNSRYLDEIALLKRGKITRDTPKHTYKRGMSAEDARATPIVKKPITIAELNSRGLRIDSDHIIYNIPESIEESKFPPNEASPLKTSSGIITTSGSGLNSIQNVIKSPKNVREYEVGNPGENAKLRISSIANKGRSYELSVDNDVCVLQQSRKNVVLITWKN